MKEKKITDKYFLVIPGRKRNEYINAETDDVFKFRVSKDGEFIRYRKNAKDLGSVKEKINGDFYKYDEFINSVVDAIIEDLHL